MKPLRFYALGAEVRGSYDGPPGHGWVEVQVVPSDAVVAGQGAIVIRLDDDLILSDDQADAIVRDRAGIVGRQPLREGDLSHVEKNALIVLAAVRHLRERPPVDEEQVAAVYRELDAARSDGLTPAQIARRLVEHGVRVGGELR